MQKRLPSEAEIAAMGDAGDVVGLIAVSEATRRRDKRRFVRAALAKLGEGGRATLLELLGDERWQRSAGAMLVDLGEDTFPVIAGQLGSDDELRRRGALHTVYLYARYRDLPAAHELLGAVAAGTAAPGLSEPAARMAEKVARLGLIRNGEVDRQLARIKASLEKDETEGGSVVSRMYSSVHRGRMEARQTIVALRYAAVRHLIAVAAEVGDAVVGAFLALALDDLGGGVVPLIEESLRSGDRRTRDVLLTTLICLRRADVPGAAEALERDGVEITGTMDRRAARFYTTWVRER